MRAGKTSAAALVAGLAALLSSVPAAAQTGDVYVIGDSLEVGTSPYLPRYLAGFSVRVDADESRSSTAGVQILQQRLQPSDEVIVFDLGTNDGPGDTGLIQSQLSEAAQLVGDRCLVVATIHRPPYGGVSYDAFNGAIESFAAGRPNTQLVDWDSYADAHPELIYSDGVHPTASGYDLRARLIAEGVQGCVGGSPATAPVAPSPDGESPFAPSVAHKVQNPLNERAEAARLVSLAYLRELGEIAAAPGSEAAAFLVGLAAVAPAQASRLSRR
jgi:lysophospholipase L1-like esterase